MAKGMGRGLGPRAKYMLMQIPGWILVLGLLLLIRRWVDLPVWAAVGVFLLWVIKDIILFPFLRPVFEPGRKSGIDRLVGAQGIATDRLAPSGYVRVGNELWRAEALEADEPIPQGSRVRIRAVRGLTLLIQPDT